MGSVGSGASLAKPPYLQVSRRHLGRIPVGPWHRRPLGLRGRKHWASVGGGLQACHEDHIAPGATPRCNSSASVSTFLNSYAQYIGPRPSADRCCAYSRFWMIWLMNASVEPLEVACHSAVSAGESSKTCSAQADTSATMRSVRRSIIVMICRRCRHVFCRSLLRY